MQERHTNRAQYFAEQVQTMTKYVIPFIQSTTTVNANSSILEIGCGEGGNLLPFLDMGCTKVVGVDILENKIENAKAYFDGHELSEHIEFICEDIYRLEDLGQFDVIFMRDVIEHIHDQERFMAFAKRFLKPTGKFFFGFPPWYNPFGGHQQICSSKFLSVLPYYHILPTPLYRGMLKLFGEPQGRIEALIEIKETGISIERFERILKAENYHTDRKTLYFINPNYEAKFGLKPRAAWSWVAGLPFLRNFLVTAGYYVVSVEQ